MAIKEITDFIVENYYEQREFSVRKKIADKIPDLSDAKEYCNSNNSNIIILIS